MNNTTLALHYASQGIPVMPTYHPSYLLRVPQERIKTWEDMQQVMARYRGQPD